jgi:hypothetical protein
VAALVEAGMWDINLFVVRGLVVTAVGAFLIEWRTVGQTEKPDCSAGP